MKLGEADTAAREAAVVAADAEVNADAVAVAVSVDVGAAQLDEVDA